MISSFFKPKSQKLKPVSSGPAGPDEDASPTKRPRDGVGNEEEVSNKRSKSAETDSKKVISDDETTQELLSYLDCHESNETTWKEVMQKHFSSPSFQRLAKFVSQQR
jgi:hypothetical protein